jgi:hypothetical protein
MHTRGLITRVYLIFIACNFNPMTIIPHRILWCHWSGLINTIWPPAQPVPYHALSWKTLCIVAVFFQVISLSSGSNQFLHLIPESNLFFLLPTYGVYRSEKRKLLTQRPPRGRRKFRRRTNVKMKSFFSHKTICLSEAIARFTKTSRHKSRTKRVLRLPRLGQIISSGEKEKKMFQRRLALIFFREQYPPACFPSWCLMIIQVHPRAYLYRFFFVLLWESWVLWSTWGFMIDQVPSI